MAKLRTDEEKAAILEHCLELEESGGDILGYLWSKDYITPRATWCNYQREWLGRKPYQYTDGKPKKQKRRDIHMNKNAAKEKEKLLNKVLERISAGKSAKEAMASLGYTGKSLGQTYRQLRIYAVDMDPKLGEILPERLNDPKKEYTNLKVVVKDGVEYEKAEEPTLADAMTGMKEVTDDFFGKCEEMGLKMDKPKQQKITQPVNYDGMMVREVEGLFGRYRRTDIGSATYIDYESKDGADELSMTVEHWKAFIVEIRNAGRILGVEV